MNIRIVHFISAKGRNIRKFYGKGTGIRVGKKSEPTTTASQDQIRNQEVIISTVLSLPGPRPLFLDSGAAHVILLKAVTAPIAFQITPSPEHHWHYPG